MDSVRFFNETYLKAAPPADNPAAEDERLQVIVETIEAMRPDVRAHGGGISNSSRSRAARGGAAFRAMPHLRACGPDARRHPAQADESARGAGHGRADAGVSRRP